MALPVYFDHQSAFMTVEIGYEERSLIVVIEEDRVLPVELPSNARSVA